jgi:hypothetical protein
VNELTEDTRHEIAATVSKAFNCTDSEFLTLMGDVYELKAEAERFTQDLS